MTNHAPSLAAPRRAWAWLRGRFRASEIWFIGLAVLIGVIAGLCTVVQADIAYSLQTLLYGLKDENRLSAEMLVALPNLLWLPVGGLLVGLLTWAVNRRRTRALVDAVEANALHGGRMSLRESIIVCVQTLISNGFGASVGLEAAYAQAGGGMASTIGKRLKLRRNDLRTLVGAGAGAAIGAAFGAPLTGAFYAFEIVIGSYAPSMIAPVAAAALASVLTAQVMGAAPYSIHLQAGPTPNWASYLLYGVLGLVCAVVGIAVMRLVAGAESVSRKLMLPVWLKPAVGGVLLAALAYISPQTLSSGHGALHLDLATGVSLGFLLMILVLKTLASAISLGSGFRGGLFFASLFLGSLVGQIFAQGIGMTGVLPPIEPSNAALVGMGAMATAIVGGPLTMSFLVLETTKDFGVTAATLAASLIASTVVRERFGYSFSTWRLHLRGETIRSARDVGWVRTLTAGRMMRKDTATFPATSLVSEFRRRFPLGSVSRVILTDDTGRYAGILPTAKAYGEDVDPEAAAGGLAVDADLTLPADMNIEQVMQTFDASETEELAVVDPEGQVLGLLAESYVSRRYAKELEKVQQGLFGEN